MKALLPKFKVESDPSKLLRIFIRSVPVKSLLLISRKVKLFKFPIEDGRLPLNAFHEMSRAVRLFKFPMEYGKLPVN